MKVDRRKPLGFRSALLVVFVALLLARGGTGQTKQRSPGDLIRYLIYQSERPDREASLLGLFSCGHVEEDRAVAASLVKMGISAIPAIEEAIKSIDERGEQSEFAMNAVWLLDAYARIKGPAAQPRLRSLIGNPKLVFLQAGLGDSVALSLGLTSYVSEFKVPTNIVDCSRPLEPRHALNQLILAWERNDRPWLEASLGPAARTAMESLLKGRSWASMRAQFWDTKTAGGGAVGYRFAIPGRWSEPEETLEEEAENGDLTPSPLNPEIETLFSNASGGDCGRLRIRFLQTQAGGKRGPLPYLVDNPDLGLLLRLIASCGEHAGKGR
jgi:hypothetical protein